MWTKIGTLTRTIVSTFLVLATLLMTAVIGVIVAFVGYFLLWGVAGLAMISGIAFLIYALIADLKTESESK